MMYVHETYCSNHFVMYIGIHKIYTGLFVNYISIKLEGKKRTSQYRMIRYL